MTSLRPWPILAAILASVILTPGAAGQDTATSSRPRGQLVERLVSNTDSTQAYALFLPDAYVETRRWPVLFVLDPRGRALLPLERLRAVANERGYIVMSSHNSLSDGRFEPNILAMNALLGDAQQSLAIDERRLYIAGFSRTARAAWLFARELGERVPGIIGTGAGIDPSFFRDDTARRPTLVFYGAIGRQDFNYDEMRELDARLDTLGVRHRVTYFRGAHSWPPDSILALRGRVAEAIRELACARRAGAVTDSTLAHRAFDPIRGSAEFRAFADSLAPDRRP
jgi:predicted esterase